MKQKSNKIIIWLLALAYAAAMLYLLFFIRYVGTPDTTDGYWQAIRSTLNLVPLRTIKMFLRQIRYIGPGDFAFRNLAGNVVMFVPFGIFLPVLFPKQRNFFRFFGTSALTIILVELLQGITLLGSCDIDDFILNMGGILIGYVLYWIFRPRKKPVSA